ncbi:MAG: hypothetical protein AB1393_12405 [Candidatus Edwardsbacteria bacterium]
MQSLEKDIRAAEKRVLIQTLSFEGDAAGTQLARLLLENPAPSRRLIIDSYSKYFISDKFFYFPDNYLNKALREEMDSTRQLIEQLKAGGVEVKYVNSAGFLFRKLVNRNHKKVIVVDDVAYIGSA